MSAQPASAVAASAQRLSRHGVKMIEFPQSPGNLTAASQNLYELIKGGSLVVFPDDHLRLAISRAIALETTRGWRITKDKSSHKIDIVVALAQAALGAVQQGEKPQGRMGTYNPLAGGDPRVHWKDEEPRQHSRLFINGREIPPQPWGTR